MTRLARFALFVFLVLPLLALAQSTVPPQVAPLPLLPPWLQTIWIYYVLPIGAAVYVIAGVISHFPGVTPDSKFGKVLASILAGSKAFWDRAQPTTSPPAKPLPQVPGLPMVFALVLAASLMSCATLKGSTLKATVSGKEADVVVTAPDGRAYGVLVANHQACVQLPQFVAMPATNLECRPACGTLVVGGAVVTVSCRVVGSLQEFPIQFAIPLPGLESKKAPPATPAAATPAS